MTHPRVFISYRHDDGAHDREVLALAERLIKDGIDVMLDRYVRGHPPTTWQRWMLDQLDAARFVLVVCTEAYYRSFRGHDTSDRGKGVDFEGVIITGQLYNSKNRLEKYLPVMLEEGLTRWIPEPIRGRNQYVLTSKKEYDRLYKVLVGAAGVEKPKPGPLKPVRREQAAPMVFPDEVSPDAGGARNEGVAPVDEHARSTPSTTEAGSVRRTPTATKATTNPPQSARASGVDGAPPSGPARSPGQARDGGVVPVDQHARPTPSTTEAGSTRSTPTAAKAAAAKPTTSTPHSGPADGVDGAPPSAPSPGLGKRVGRIVKIVLVTVVLLFIGTMAAESGLQAFQETDYYTTPQVMTLAGYLQDPAHPRPRWLFDRPVASLEVVISDLFVAHTDQDSILLGQASASDAVDISDTGYRTETILVPREGAVVAGLTVGARVSLQTRLLVATQLSQVPAAGEVIDDRVLKELDGDTLDDLRHWEIRAADPQRREPLARGPYGDPDALRFADVAPEPSRVTSLSDFANAAPLDGAEPGDVVGWREIRLLGCEHNSQDGYYFVVVADRPTAGDAARPHSEADVGAHWAAVCFDRARLSEWRWALDLLQDREVVVRGRLRPPDDVARPRLASSRAGRLVGIMDGILITDPRGRVPIHLGP